MRTREIFGRLERLPQWAVVGSALVLTGALSFVDWITGRDLSFLIFYLVPIGFASWFAGARWGVTVALLSGVVWYMEDVMGRTTALSPLNFSWNLATKGIFLVVISRLFSRLKDAMESEANMARTDPLTGVANRRTLFDVMEFEVKSMARDPHPVSVAFMDLDNFKAVNDSMGHDSGDALLKAVVHGLKEATRDSDLVARMGGDEFVVLLPGTDAGQACDIVSRMRDSVMARIKSGGWPCTLSIGLTTCGPGSCSTDEIIAWADKLMYLAKKGGKGRTIQEPFGRSAEGRRGKAR